MITSPTATPATKETKMNYYRISNLDSGADLGVFIAADRDTALDAMARDAGYQDAADSGWICGEASLIVDELIAVSIVEAGDGFPGEGDYVTDGDTLYQVVVEGSRIETYGPGPSICFGYQLEDVSCDWGVVSDDAIHPCGVEVM